MECVYICFYVCVCDAWYKPGTIFAWECPKKGGSIWHKKAENNCVGKKTMCFTNLHTHIHVYKHIYSFSSVLRNLWLIIVVIEKQTCNYFTYIHNYIYICTHTYTHTYAYIHIYKYNKVSFITPHWCWCCHQQALQGSESKQQHSTHSLLLRLLLLLLLFYCFFCYYIVVVIL